MTRFQFRLESLRALREQAEHYAKEELARELARKAECEAALSAARARLAQARGAGQLDIGSAVPAHELVSLQAYVERRERERRAAEARVQAQELEVGESKQRLTDAARDRELLERLKERRAGEHRETAARAEETTLAEIALTTHRRSRGGGAA